MDKSASQIDLGDGAGIYPLTITATDSDGLTVTDTFTWTITNVAPLAVADTNSINEEGTTTNGNVLTNDADGAPDTDALMVSAINGGTYGSIVINSDGSYTYTIDNLNAAVQALDAGQTLIDTLIYSADDKEGGTSDATLDITITGVNDTPLVGTPITDQAHTDGQASISLDVSAAFTPSTDNGDTLVAFNLTSGTLPSGLALATSTGLITGTMDKSASQIDLGDGAGIYPLTITATDSDGLTVTDTFTWAISNVAPLAVADTNSINEEGTTTNGNVLTNDADGAPDTDALMVSAINGGTYGSIVINSDGSYTYTIDNLNAAVQALDAGQTLIDTLIYSADDKEGGTSDATLDITITGVNDTPLVGTPIADQAHTDGQAGISLDVSAAFTPSTDNGDTLVAFNLTSGTLPSGLALATSTGLVTGTMDKSASQIDLGDGAGIYPLTITATDSDGLTVTDTFTWTITNVAPLAVADTNSINEEGTTTNGNVLTNDADGAPDTDALMVSAINGGTVGAATAGTYGSVVINSDGSYSYTIDNLNPTVQALDAGQTLIDTFTYTADDNEGGYRRRHPGHHHHRR